MRAKRQAGIHPHKTDYFPQDWPWLFTCVPWPPRLYFVDPDEDETILVITF